MALASDLSLPTWISQAGFRGLAFLQPSLAGNNPHSHHFPGLFHMMPQPPGKSLTTSKDERIRLTDVNAWLMASPHLSGFGPGSWIWTFPFTSHLPCTDSGLLDPGTLRTASLAAGQAQWLEVSHVLISVPNVPAGHLQNLCVPSTFSSAEKG